MNTKQSSFVHCLALLLIVLYLPTSGSAKPSCPGHPSCNGDGGSDGSIQLGSGNDSWPGSGDDNSGNDTVNGGAGDDSISGGPGNDDLNGEADNDLLYGEEGDDDLSGGNGFDQLFGGPGTDHLRVDLSGVFIGGIEQGDFADGGTSVNANGKEDKDYMHLGHLDVVHVVFDSLSAIGTYVGSYSRNGKNGGTIDVYGEFKNIKFIYGTNGKDTYIGNDLDNEIWGYDGDDTMYGMGGNDSLGSPFDGGKDYFDGGTGNDSFQGQADDDYIIGGPGNDKLWTREGHGHDVMEDFADGEDLIIIYNSNECFPDLVITMIDWDLDGDNDDTNVAWGGNHKGTNTSVTLLNVDSSVVSADDFDFEVDNPNYSGCP